MHGREQLDNSLFPTISHTARIALSVPIVFALVMFAAPAMPAQTLTVIHSFSGGAGGISPQAGVTMDAADNLYGTTYYGGTHGYGMVFELKHFGSGWLFTPLYSFAGGNDGANPWGRVVIGPDGALYGTTSQGGGSQACPNGLSNSCGTVFNLRPPARTCATTLCSWTETVLYRFTGASDGGIPGGDLTFDQSGNIYGSAGCCGTGGGGVVYELRPSGDGWTEAVISSPSGASLAGGVIFDRSGNLYGVGVNGEFDYGAVYELSPSGPNWTEQTLYSFSAGSDGYVPTGGLIIDPAGNLYGTTVEGGSGRGGTVFQLMPANGGWAFNLIYGLSGTGGYRFPGPWDKLGMDAAGNVYGTTFVDGAHGQGSVFKLTPSNGGWTYTSLHDFTGGSDGGNPISNIVFDANGNLYGTATVGGAYGQGVVFEITP